MTVLEEVAGLIKKVAPDAICDDCIADKLSLSVRQHANHKTRELAKLRGFMRGEGKCSFCGSDKKIIRII
jgi:hypothetical protein